MDCPENVSWTVRRMYHGLSGKEEKCIVTLRKKQLENLQVDRIILKWTLNRMTWCGVVWCGVVWCGVVWCGVVWCGVAWCGVAWCGVAWRGVAWRGVL